MQSVQLVGGKAGPGVQAGPVSSSCPAGMQTTLAPARRHPGNGKLAALQVPGRPGARSCCPSPTREQSALLQCGGNIPANRKLCGGGPVAASRRGAHEHRGPQGPPTPARVCTHNCTRGVLRGVCAMLSQDRHPAKRTTGSCSHSVPSSFLFWKIRTGRACRVSSCDPTGDLTAIHFGCTSLSPYFPQFLHTWPHRWTV